MLGSLQVLATLRAQGWHRSVTGGPPVDTTGEPRPWLTYAAAEWLDQVLTRQTRMFEYGAGSSSAWFAGRVGEIVAVEHDEAWFARLAPPRNGRILLRPYRGGWWDADDTAAYVRAIERGAPWHVVMVDGTARTACARVAADHLTPDGMVILDDTDREKSRPAQRELSGRGLGRLDFWGFKPGIGTRACTTVFGRDFNPWLRRAAARTGSPAEP
jgi:hypothetical protein